MRFLADECIDAALVTALRTAGHDVRTVQEIRTGLTDSEVLTIAADDRRILVTEDKDFGEHAFRNRYRPLLGVVLLRIPPEQRGLKWQRLAAAIEHYGEALHGHYTVVDLDRTRRRRLPSL